MSKKLRFEKIYADNFGLVRHVFKKFSFPEQEVEDLLHDVFLSIYHRLDDIEAGYEKAFLITSARNLAIDTLRKRQRRKTDQQNQESMEPSAGLWESDPEHELQLHLLGSLIDEIAAEPGGKSFALYYREGLTLKQIAQQEQEPIGTISARVSRLREKFRKKIQTKLMETTL